MTPGIGNSSLVATHEAMPRHGMIVSDIFQAGHRSREMALNASLVNRVVFLAEKAATRFFCPGGTF